MGVRTGYLDHTVASVFNNRRRGIGADNLQTKADGKSFVEVVGRSGDLDGITGVSQRDCMPDGLAGGLGRLAVVVVTAVYPIDIPCAAG
jgi:hypothetical protein